MEKFKIHKDIKVIEFSDEYDSPIDSLRLTESVEMIIFGKKFNQPLDNFDLKNVKYIIFGSMFNRNIDRVNFRRCIFVNFGFRFNRIIRNESFKNLRTLNFQGIYNRRIQYMPFLEKLQVGYAYSFFNDITSTNFPNLKEFNIYNNITKLDLDKFQRLNYIEFLKKNKHFIFDLDKSSATNLVYRIVELQIECIICYSCFRKNEFCIPVCCYSITNTICKNCLIKMNRCPFCRKDGTFNLRNME